jgi:hypothetical protein
MTSSRLPVYRPGPTWHWLSSMEISEALSIRTGKLSQKTSGKGSTSTSGWGQKTLQPSMLIGGRGCPTSKGASRKPYQL